MFELRRDVSVCVAASRRCVDVVHGVDVGVARGFGVGVDHGVGDTSWHRCWSCDVAVLVVLRSHLGVARGIGVGVGLWRRC